MTVNELEELGLNLSIDEDGEFSGEIDSDGILENVVSGDFEVDENGNV